VWASLWPPGSLLLAVASLREFKVFAICPVQFRENFMYNFSETKNSRKQELALRHWVNRLVPENAQKVQKNIHKPYKNQYKTSMEHQKL
jgi:hypothetical protein